MDYSRMSTLLSCPQEYEYRYEMGLKPPGDRLSAFYGTLWHEVMRLNASPEFQYRDGMRVVGEAAENIKWADPSNDYRTQAKAVTALRLYRQYWYREPWEFLKTEHKYDTMIGLSPQHGRIDAVVRLPDGRIAVVDYKTTSGLSDNWPAEYRNSNQFAFYRMAERAHCAIVDIYHATKGNKKGQDEYETTGNRFYRLVIEHSVYQELRTAFDLLTAERVLALYQERKYFPKNTQHCHQFGGTCPFIDICTAQDHVERRAIIETFSKVDSAGTQPASTEVSLA